MYDWPNNLVTDEFSSSTMVVFCENSPKVWGDSFELILMTLMGFFGESTLFAFTQGSWYDLVLVRPCTQYDLVRPSRI